MSAPRDPPRFLVCEDGHEYTERFARLLGGSFRFERAGHYAEVRAACWPPARPRRACCSTSTSGAPRAETADRRVGGGQRPRGIWPEETRRRLAEVQGILILRALRVGRA